MTTATSNTVHATFTIERTIKAAPARVYAAFADQKMKAKWFGGREKQWTPEVQEMDYRVGGRERVRAQWHNGKVSDFQAQYFDIVPNERIVYVYDMFVDEHKMSVSLATIEFSPAGEGTLLKLTEQGVFFDGMQDAAGREQGTVWLMGELAATVE